jgi:chromosome segregation ATPase
MFLALLTLVVAISISVIAAYYSIVGLTAIFAAAFLPIILMGSVLEVGKLLATVWLHQNWHRAPLIMKGYLTTAVVVLMFITSMGVFGFLSKSHIEQSSVGTEQLAQATVVDNKMARIDAKIARWSEDIVLLNAGGNSGRIDNLIKREQSRITEASIGIKPQIDAENEKIPGLRSQADKEIKQQNKRLNDAQTRTSAEISQAEKRLIVLDKDVDAYTSQGTNSGGIFTADVDNVRKGAELRKAQRPERDLLNSAIKKAKSNEIGVASAVQRQITKINSRLSTQIGEVEKRISKIRDGIKSTVDNANANIAKYTNDAGTTNEGTDAKIADLENLIESVQPQLDKLREDKFMFEKNYRQFEAEVGPVKYIAELVYGEANRSQLEEAVRWVIIIIVAVFDPLAICLVLAGTMTISWVRQEKALARKQIQQVVDTPAAANNANSKLIEELEMELKKHNDILTELEILLDSNLSNMDPKEYAKLKAEYELVLEERDTLAKALSEVKLEGDGLIDKIVATEEERDSLRTRIDSLLEGSAAFESRITELLAKIADLEAEVERRDAVVVKMAQKYQLVEKDEFADELVNEAEETVEEDPTIKNV